MHDDLWKISTPTFRNIQKKYPQVFWDLQVFFAEQAIMRRDLVYKSVLLMSSLSLEERP